MTSSNGYQSIKAPCCQAEFASIAYMSINYSCSEYWSDGRAVKSLAPLDGGLRKCICGKYFLYRQAVSGPVIYNSLPLPPENWENEDVWEGFLRGGQSKRDYLLAKYDFRSESERERERLEKPLEEIIVQDSELSDLLVSEFLNTDVLIVARRRYWRYLNDEYRSIYRAYKKVHNGGYPMYIPTELQKENMLHLLKLLESQVKPDYLEIAELHRELGNFQIARNVIENNYIENDRKKEIVDFMLNLILCRESQPCIVNMGL